MNRLLLLTASFSLICLLAACDSGKAGDPASAGTGPATLATETSVSQPEGGSSEAQTTGELASNVEKRLKPDIKAAPRFDDYKVAEGFSGNTPTLMFNAETSEFRTQLGAAAKEKPNFAGHYIVAKWGCGTDCQMGGVIDAKTGATFLIPFTVCCVFETGEDLEMMDFHPGSSLIIFNGLLNEDESTGWRHFYTFENGEFVLIPSVKAGKDSFAGGTVAKAESWQCHNDLEVSCSDGKCAASKGDAFTPMSVTISTSGAMSVCAYSGCWEGDATVESSDEFLVWIGSDLPFSTATLAKSSRQSIVIALDKADKVATMKAGGFALPILCH